MTTSGPRRFSFSDWLAVLGLSGTVMGFALSYYFYRESRVYPLLTFTVHPLKTELKRPEFAQELGFTYRGHPLSAPVLTSAQAALWNDGTRSVRREDVLAPLAIAVESGEILSVQLKSVSRQVCAISVIEDPKQWAQGVCPIDFRILEPGDGCVVQLIYAGDAAARVRLHGVVEGQRHIYFLAQPDYAETQRRMDQFQTAKWVALWFTLGLLGLVLIVRVIAHYRRLPSILIARPALIWALFIVVVSFAAGLYATANTINEPPFGW